MAAVLIENPVDVRVGDAARAPRDGARGQLLLSEGEIAIELGIWLSGLESFLASGHHSFADSADARLSADSSKEFRLVQVTVERCALLTSALLSPGTWINSPQASAKGIVHKDVAGLASALRDASVLGTSLIRSNSHGAGEWKAWCKLLSSRFSELSAFSSLIGFAEQQGEGFLPAKLLELTENRSQLDAERAELAFILPRFAKILKWLSVVGRMLEADEPLKPALLIFSRVNEQIFELTTYINNRLERFPNEEAELFAALDAASYTASIELKKVYSQELAGLARLRPSPSIYARMETAYALLNEGFQQILAGFAQIVDPDSTVFELFPNFAVKRQQSLELRKELWAVAQIVQQAEADPGKDQIEALHKSLRGFIGGTARFLFYKDTETVERFIEEILVTKQNKDLVPILHRFGAYLETLFGQVNLRIALQLHPFEAK